MGEGFVTRRGGKAGAEPGIVIEAGLIVEFFGLVSSIPSGWALCDGTNDTPDLRDKFIIGAGDLYSVEDTGGSVDAVLIGHTHTGTLSSVGNHTHTGSYSNAPNEFFNTRPRSSAESSNSSLGSPTGAHSHTVTINNAGSSPTNANLPPYYSLFHIIKLEDN